MTGAAPVPDLDQARRFLTMLDPDAEAFTLQTATDDPKVKATYPIGRDGKRKDPLARIINLPPDTLRALAVRNANGAAVWVMINAGDGRGRTAENVTRVRSVFCDLDGSPVQPVMACELEPHCVVETSPGRFHCYWLVDDLPLDQFEAVQRRIATMFDGDSVCDQCRVMRLPGHPPRQRPRQAVSGSDRASGRAPALSGGRHLARVPAARGWQAEGDGQRARRSARPARA